MVRIRLRRMGANKKPFYRIVVADKRSPRDGRFIETIGTYDPLTEPETVTLRSDRAAHWLSVGAQPSEAVARILRNQGLLDQAGKPIAVGLDVVDEVVVDEIVVDEVVADEIVADEVVVEAEVVETADAVVTEEASAA